VSLPRLSSLAADTNAPATAAPSSATTNAPAEPLKPRTGQRLPEFGVHDPWMLAEKSTQTYYLYTSAPPRQTGLNRSGTFAYKSKDLATWTGRCSCSRVRTIAGRFRRKARGRRKSMLTGQILSLHHAAQSHEAAARLGVPARPNFMRSTMIAVSDSPEGRSRS